MFFENALIVVEVWNNCFIIVPLTFKHGEKCQFPILAERFNINAKIKWTSQDISEETYKFFVGK